MPDGITDAEVDAIRIREAARSRELAAGGYLLRLWRPPLDAGQWRTWGQAADATELDCVLSSMPLRVWRHDTVTPLTPHPSDPGSGDVMTDQAPDDEAAMLDAVLTRYYYAAQPAGLTAQYTLRETRQLSDGLILGYLTADFGGSDRNPHRLPQRDLADRPLPGVAPRLRPARGGFRPR